METDMEVVGQAQSVGSIPPITPGCRPFAGFRFIALSSIRRVESNVGVPGPRRAVENAEHGRQAARLIPCPIVTLSHSGNLRKKPQVFGACHKNVTFAVEHARQEMDAGCSRALARACPSDPLM
jgi:hypothetical protein